MSTGDNMPNEDSLIKKVFTNVANAASAITGINSDTNKTEETKAEAKEPEFVLELADELLGDSLQISSDSSKPIKAEQEAKQKEAKEIVQEMLTKLFDEDSIKKIADKDSNGITIDEARDYLSSIAGNDGDASSLSIDDIEKALKELGINPEDILNEKVRELLDKQETAETKEAEKAKEAEKVNKAQEANQSQASGGSSGAGGSSGVGGGGSSSGTSGAGGASSSSETSDTKNTDNMSADEIKAEIQTKESELSKFQEELSAITNGSDSEIKALEDAEDEAYEAYQEKMQDEAGFLEGKIDGANPKTINEQKEKAEEAQNKLNQNQADTIAEQGKLDSANSKISSCDSRIASLDASIASLQEAINSAEEGKDTSDLQAKLSAAQSEKQTVEQEKQKAEAERDAAQKELDRLSNEKTTLETELKEAEDKLTELQNKYEEKHPDVKEAREAWEKAKEAVQAKKEEKMQSVQDKIKTTQDEISSLNQKYTEALNAEHEKDYNAQTASTELNEGIMKGELAGKEELIVQIADEYGIEPEFFAAIIGLESGWGTSAYAKNNYNYGGVTGSGDAGYTTRESDGYKFAKYSSPEAGLRAMAKNLASYPERYSDVSAVNFDNVDAIGAHYCPGGQWPSLIAGTYKTIKKA